MSVAARALFAPTSTEHDRHPLGGHRHGVLPNAAGSNGMRTSRDVRPTARGARIGDTALFLAAAAHVRGRTTTEETAMNATVQTDFNGHPLLPGALYALVNYESPPNTLAWYAGNNVWFSDLTDERIEPRFDEAVRQPGAFDSDLAQAPRDAFLGATDMQVAA